MTVAPKTQAEIDAEKASKSVRVDLVSPWFAFFAGRAMAYGAGKHGTGLTGRGTFRDPGEQSMIDTHVRSFERHWNAWRRGELVDPDSELSHFDCACAQISILADLIGDPPKHDVAPARTYEIVRRGLCCAHTYRLDALGREIGCARIDRETDVDYRRRMLERLDTEEVAAGLSTLPPGWQWSNDGRDAVGPYGRVVTRDGQTVYRTIGGDEQDLVSDLVIEIGQIVHRRNTGRELELTDKQKREIEASR